MNDDFGVLPDEVSGEEEVVEVYEPEIEPVSAPREPAYKGILDAIDNEDAKAYFFNMLGYQPVYDRKGKFVGYTRTKRPDFDDQLTGFLSAIRSPKILSIADIRGVDPLTTLEVEWATEVIQELILLQAPPDADILPYLPPIEWAKLEMKRSLSLAKDGKLVNAILGVPYMSQSQEPAPFFTQSSEREERKLGFLGKLLGRA